MYCRLNNFDIFCVSETWLHESIKNDEIRIPGYNVFRKDRTTGVGGVCTYVKETMHVNMGVDLMFENIEAIWVEIRQGDTKYLVSCIYRPLLPRQNFMKKSLTCLNVLGWLSIPLFLWVILSSITFWMRLYLLIQSNIETTYDMHQLIDQPTRVDDKTSSVLDVILMSHPALHRWIGVNCIFEENICSQN